MIKSRAIILHRFPYSDSSWIVKALTEECGIVSFIVKGGKSKDSPFKGALDPLASCEVVFRENPHAELLFVKEASILNWHKNLRENLLYLAGAQVMAEIILRYAPQGVPLQEEFLLLEEALSQLDAGDDSGRDETALENCADSVSNPTAAGREATALENRADSASNPTAAGNVFARFLLNICDLWGYHLDLTACSCCETALTEPPADFQPETGALICKACLGVSTSRARPETLRGLWSLRTGTSLVQPQFTENALLAYLRNHIGFMKDLKSLQFLNETRKLYFSP